MEVSDVQWITFDMGGTLLFPNPSVGEIYAEILANHGHRREPRHLEETFMRVWREDVQKCLPVITAASERERWRKVVTRTFADVTPVDIDGVFDDLWHAFYDAGRWRLPTDTLPTLKTLRDRGYRLAVLSNWDERLRRLLDEIGLTPHFEEVFISCEVGCEKPDPRIFAAVEKNLGASGPQILHVGDSYRHDVEGGRNRGWRVVQAFCDLSPEPDCHRIQSLPELLDLLPGRNGKQPSPSDPAG